MAFDQKQKRLKGIYLVPDPMMMKPHFGPSEHIKVGLGELKKYFDIELLILGEYNHSVEIRKSRRSITKHFATRNGFVGLLRDLKLMYRSNKDTKTLVRRLRELKIDFIYERGQYLDFRGVRAAEKIGVKHFYEVNCLNFLCIRQFYKSWFNPFSKQIEEWAYKRSTLNFFIGTQHTLIDIPSNKVHTIQNGIHAGLMDDNRSHINLVEGNIRICYVANLMPHHRFDIFVEALQISGVEDRLELHMIGYNFEEFEKRLPSRLKYILHGPKKKEELSELIRSCNVGIISGGPGYSSFMKLFEYAALKMCVICPDLENICLMFNKSEILYFKTDSAKSLAFQLRTLCENPGVINQYGANIYKKVRERYTWEKIYGNVSDEIKRAMPL